jgi:hypothetical protein
VKPLFPLKSKKVGIIRDSDLLMIARKIDEVTKRVKSAENSGAEAKAESMPDLTPPQTDSLQAEPRCEKDAS